MRVGVCQFDGSFPFEAETLAATLTFTGLRNGPRKNLCRSTPNSVRDRLHVLSTIGDPSG